MKAMAAESLQLSLNDAIVCLRLKPTKRLATTSCFTKRIICNTLNISARKIRPRI